MRVMTEMTQKHILALWVSENAAHVKPIEPCLKGVRVIVLTDRSQKEKFEMSPCQTTFIK